MLTFEEYYERFVRSNLDQAIEELQREPRRIYSLECIFFLRLYWDRCPAQLDKIRSLVNEGHLRLTSSGITTTPVMNKTSIEGSATISGRILPQTNRKNVRRRTAKARITMGVFAFQIAGSEGLRLLHADGEDAERESAPAPTRLLISARRGFRNGLISPLTSCPLIECA